MENQKEIHVDVIVVGGGPSGLMASLAARHAGASVLLLEKGDKLGRKLGISGGGRCNVTNAKPLDQLMQNIPGNARFLYSALHQFSNEHIITFFEGLGIRLKEEDRGRVFPVTDKAATVVRALVDAVFDAGVDVWSDTPVKKLLTEGSRVCGAQLRTGQMIYASSVILCTGGCSVPKTGSTGDAYPWAKKVGHTIVDPYPTEVPLTSDEPWIQKRILQGISLRGVNITIKTEKGKRLTTENGDMIFTHLGLSGPAALRCSHYVSTAHRKNPSTELIAEIDCLPEVSKSEFSDLLQQAKITDPRKQLSTYMSSRLTERLADFILTRLGVDGRIQLAHLKQETVQNIALMIKAFPVRITGTLPLAQATVTGGGVSVKEIDPSSMASKCCQGLFFAGELMDVHAHTGGYNITVAFSTGHLAGTSAAEFALQNHGAPLTPATPV